GEASVDALQPLDLDHRSGLDLRAELEGDRPRERFLVLDRELLLERVVSLARDLERVHARRQVADEGALAHQLSVDVDEALRVRRADLHGRGARLGGELELLRLAALDDDLPGGREKALTARQNLVLAGIDLARPWRLA